MLRNLIGGILSSGIVFLGCSSSEPAPAGTGSGGAANLGTGGSGKGPVAPGSGGSPILPNMSTGGVAALGCEQLNASQLQGGQGTGGASPLAAGSSGVAGSSGSAGASGSAVDCSRILSGPFEAKLALDVFDGAEDIAFDGKGHLAGKKGDTLILAQSNGMSTVLAPALPLAAGLRYLSDGNLVVALPSQGKVVRVSAAGEVSDWLMGISVPNGVYPDFSGNVWLTEFGADRVLRVDAAGNITPIAMGDAAKRANGILFDEVRKLLFFTNYEEGRIRSVDVSGLGPFVANEAVVVRASKFDGLALDRCGHLYAVDNANDRLYRSRLDASGKVLCTELLASFPTSVANAQFGKGPGFDPATLYVTGEPGKVYAVPVGVPGVAVPMPP